MTTVCDKMMRCILVIRSSNAAWMEGASSKRDRRIRIVESVVDETDRKENVGELRPFNQRLGSKGDMVSDVAVIAQM